MFFIFCSTDDTEVCLEIYDMSSQALFSPFEITYLNTEAQWGGLLERELHIEPQQPNLAKGEKSAAHETRAFDCWDTRKHTTKQERFRDKHTRSHAHTQTHVHTNHAPRDSSHTDTVAVPLWH